MGQDCHSLLVSVIRRSPLLFKYTKQKHKGRLHRAPQPHSPRAPSSSHQRAMQLLCLYFNMALCLLNSYISWQPNGPFAACQSERAVCVQSRFFALCGFGNLPGDILFYDKKADGKCKLMSQVRYSPALNHCLTLQPWRCIALALCLLRGRGCWAAAMPSSQALLLQITTPCSLVVLCSACTFSLLLASVWLEVPTIVMHTGLNASFDLHGSMLACIHALSAGPNRCEGHWPCLRCCSCHFRRLVCAT